MNSYRIPDPIRGIIEIPNWSIKIQNTEPIRRMMFIRQLGLKAYVDFAGAIHTRYAHILGTMHLANKLIDILLKKETIPLELRDNLKDNKNTVMAAAFLHDVGHGPFSHAVDYVLKLILKKTHEEISYNIIKDELSSIEDYGIPANQVTKIINGKHSNNFISQI